MTTNPMLTSRMDPAVVARIDRCVIARNAAAEPGTRPVDRGAILRLLVMRALPALEAELGIATAKPKLAKPAQKGATKPARKP
jgi:hypothetical protein